MSTAKKTPFFFAALVIVPAILGTYFFFYSEELVFKRQVAGAREDAMQWLITNVRENGLFVYRYNPQTGQTQDVNNDVRQLLASRIFAVESNKNRSLLELHQKNLDFIFKFWYREEVIGDTTVGYILYNDRSKLGANAMLVRTLSASPLYIQYQKETARLAESILALQHTDGSFDPWYIEPPGTYNKERYLYFYSGEAIVALLELYERTGSRRYLEAAERAQDFYIGEYVDRIEENYYPAYVPWHTIALNKLYKITGSKKYATAIFILNDKLLELLDTTRVVGRFYDPETPEYGSAHASSDAVYTEGLVYAYEIARSVGDSERSVVYEDAIKLAAAHLYSLQYTKKEFPSYSPPEKYLGGIRVSDTNPEIRIDTVQHTVDALTKVLEVL